MKINVEWSELLIEKGKLDPLGLWRVGDRLIGELLSPFTTVVQQRPARYFSMYCWILAEAGRGLSEKAKPEEFWGRFFVLEGIFLCATQLHDPHAYAGFGGRIGSEHAG